MSFLRPAGPAWQPTSPFMLLLGMHSQRARDYLRVGHE